VSDADARRLLRAYLPVVRRIAATLYAALPEDEALATGTDAVLEAFLSLDPSRAAEGTWVRRVVHWRLAEAVRRQPWDRQAESLDVDPQLLNGQNPAEAYERASAIAAIAGLPVRCQMVVVGRMRGETYAEVGESLGISPQRAHQVERRALLLLRLELEPAPAPAEPEEAV
jgi:RNA polymerase sigma factor (sigma-70 family)